MPKLSAPPAGRERARGGGSASLGPKTVAPTPGQASKTAERRRRRRTKSH